MPEPLYNARQLRERRATLITEARGVLDAAHAASRDMTTEEETRFNGLHSEADTLLRRIETIERQESAEAEARASRGRLAGGADTPPDQRGADAPDAEGRALEHRAFRNWMVNGVNGLSDEERGVLATRQHTLSPELRALTSASGASGGYTVPQDFYRTLTEAMVYLGGVRASSATVIATESGAPMPMPEADDTSHEGEMLGENTETADNEDPAFGSKTLNAYIFSSKVVKVPVTLLTDSAFNIEAYLFGNGGAPSADAGSDSPSRQARGILPARLGRATNRKYTTGTGTNQPQGIVTGATLGKTGASGQTTSITYDDLVDLQHSVDPSYRVGAEWMFHDTTLRALKKLKDSEGRPLWLPGLALREPDTILDHRYVINQHMEEMAAGAKSVLFGSMSHYRIRDVAGGIVLVRFAERYMNALQVGFLAFMRTDGRLADAGTHPVKFYQNAAS